MWHQAPVATRMNPAFAASSEGGGVVSGAMRNLGRFVPSTSTTSGIDWNAVPSESEGRATAVRAQLLRIQQR